MRELFLNLGLAFIPVSVSLTVLWLSARERARRAEAIIHQIALASAARGAVGTSAPRDYSPELEAIALDVERIAEGQRFTTQRLSERRDHVLPMRAVTPH